SRPACSRRATRSRRSRPSWKSSASGPPEVVAMRFRLLIAAAAATLALAACSQKDPAAEAIAAAENALNAVYDDAEKYVPERYAEVKGELAAARKAFDEERYADAIAAVKDVPAHAEALGKEAAEGKEKHVAGVDGDSGRLFGSVP